MDQPQRPHLSVLPPTDDLALGDDGDVAGGRQAGNLFDSDIRATTKAFNTKIQQKKKEQERVLDEAERRSRMRQSYIIQALVGMRKSLREVTRLDLGERFHFIVTTDEWQGWPRVTLSVVDDALSDASYPPFQIVSGFRDDKAQIDLHLGDPDNVLNYNLMSEADVRKLSGTFKKSVRSYLDMIGDVILQAERAPVERPIDEIAVAVVEEETPPEEEIPYSLDDDIYNDFGSDSIFEELPHLESVEALPAWGSNQPGPKTRR